MNKFTCTTSLMPYQRDAVAKLLPPRVGALFMDMGTGKSRTIIELARLRQHKWDRLFWFTPCALRHNVRAQILEHTDIPASQIAIWDGKTMNNGIPDVRIHIVGVESMGASSRTVMAYNALLTDRAYVVVDESSYIKGHTARRTQRLMHMSKRSRYRAILTGTPMTQGAVDLYSQMAFLSPAILGYKSFWRFAANHLEFEERKLPSGKKVRTGRIVRSHNSEYLAAKMAPYVYQVRKDECLELPEKLYECRSFSMTPEQRGLYEAAKMEILDLPYEDWSPIKIFHLFTSLQSVVCGFYRDTAGVLHTAPHERLKLLMATVAEIPPDEKIIIWGKYRACVREICQTLTKEYGANEICAFYGEQSDAQREADLMRWRQHARFLVATQSAGGHGLTLNEASYVIFYANSFKYSERIQAEDRNHRIGQMRRPMYTNLQCACSIDDKIEQALICKGDALESFRKEIDVCRTKGLRQRAIELVEAL